MLQNAILLAPSSGLISVSFTLEPSGQCDQNNSFVEKNHLEYLKHF